MFNLLKMSRAVWREGKTVRFQSLVGAFVGSEYVYRFPTVAQAIRFEKFANERDLLDTPVAIPERFRKHRVFGHA